MSDAAPPDSEGPPDVAGVAPDPDAPPAGRTGRRRPLLVIGRIAVALLAVAALGIAGWGYAVTRQVEQGIAERGVDALVSDDSNIVAPSLPPAGSVDPGVGGANGADPGGAGVGAAPGAPENILILGLDTRPPGEAAAVGGTSQSDVIMIAHLSGDRRRLDVLSIPRDLMITAPTCKAWDYATNSLSDRDFDNPYAQWKITNAYAVGGPQCTVRALQALTGVRIDRVIVINFEGFKSIVDAMGGIQMTFPGQVVDDGRVIVERAGPQTVRGDQALALARARKVAGDPTGDIGRIGRQQQLLSAMLSEAVSTGMLLDPARLSATLDVIVANTATDNVTIDDLLTLSLALRGSGSAEVDFHTLPTVPDPGTDGLEQAAGTDTFFSALVNDQEFPANAGGG